MNHTIAIVGALDTKGSEFAFLKAEIEKRGCRTLVVDTGVLDLPAFAPDVGRDIVMRAGGVSPEDLVARHDRGEAMAVMARGLPVIVQQLHAEGRIDGIIGMGGSGGSAVASAAMRALPVGFPKLLVSTVASGDTSGYVGTSDLTMMPSVVDVAGVNRISRTIFTNAAGAICGMVLGPPPPESGDDRPLIAASMFGNTTQAVDHARSLLEAAGYEVLVFHATGVGGRTLEALADGGYLAGVLDMTTTEWADEVCGGVLTAGSHRLEAAGRAGIPQVVVPGCIDMCNFHALDTVPERYRERLLYPWNPNITLMRTTPEENAQMGTLFAEKLNMATGPVTVLIPLGGFSQLDSAGQPFWLPEADQAFVTALRAELRSDIPMIERPHNINDPEFAGKAAEILIEMLATKEGGR